MHRFKELEKFRLYHELKVKIFQDFKFSLSTFKLKNNIKNFKNSVGLGRIFKFKTCKDYNSEILKRIKIFKKLIKFDLKPVRPAP